MSLRKPAGWRKPVAEPSPDSRPPGMPPRTSAAPVETTVWVELPTWVVDAIYAKPEMSGDIASRIQFMAARS